MKLSAHSLLKNLPNENSLLKLFPKLQEEKAQSFTTIVLTLGASAVFGLFAISPTLGTIADLRKQLDDSVFVDQQLKQKIANLSTLQQKYTQVQPDLPIIMDAIPSSATIAPLVGQLQTLADTSGISVARIQTFPVEVSAANAKAPYVSYTFSLDVQGSYSGITTFISTLGNFERLLVIDGISLAQATTPGGAIRATIKGKAYFKSL